MSAGGRGLAKGRAERGPLCCVAALCCALWVRGAAVGSGCRFSFVASVRSQEFPRSPAKTNCRRLEWIVIWLIVLEVIVGLFESASILGWVGQD